MSTEYLKNTELLPQKGSIWMHIGLWIETCLLLCSLAIFELAYISLDKFMAKYFIYVVFKYNLLSIFMFYTCSHVCSRLWCCVDWLAEILSSSFRDWLSNYTVVPSTKGWVFLLCFYAFIFFPFSYML